MGFAELLLLSVGLAMDAFSVAVCKGLSMKRIDYVGAFTTALFFGVFQAIMPLIGYFLGRTFAGYITAVDHWVAFVLLAVIGGKMLWEAVTDKDEPGEVKAYKLDIKELFLLAVATSIDALAVGVVFAVQDTPIAGSVCTIGLITFALSFAGVAVGNRFGSRFGSKAEIAGGIILILIGLKILLSDLGILP
ncbi:MAG: manganese efflux pump [Ruminococcus sp.]|nr:manganese efflux pump [Ruminococcus sp.]